MNRTGTLRIVLATANRGKRAELRALFEGAPIEWVERDDLPAVEESGTTYAENATLKAKAVAAHTGEWALADDSGLEVAQLEGRPGLASARYGGPDATDADRRRKLLSELKGRPPAYRKAKFVCVLALASPSGSVHLCRGECAGRIAPAEQGDGGFGYDAIFLLPELRKTMAELSEREKNRLSHRARAVEELRRLIPKLA